MSAQTKVQELPLRFGWLRPLYPPRRCNRVIPGKMPPNASLLNRIRQPSATSSAHNRSKRNRAKAQKGLESGSFRQGSRCNGYESNGQAFQTNTRAACAPQNYLRLARPPLHRFADWQKTTEAATCWRVIHGLSVGLVIETRSLLPSQLYLPFRKSLSSIPAFLSSLLNFCVPRGQRCKMLTGDSGTFHRPRYS